MFTLIQNQELTTLHITFNSELKMESTCRLCLSPNNLHIIDIFSEYAGSLNVCEVLNKYLWFNVSKMKKNLKVFNPQISGLKFGIKNLDTTPIHFLHNNRSSSVMATVISFVLIVGVKCMIFTYSMFNYTKSIMHSN